MIESWTMPTVIGEADPYRYAKMARWRAGPLRVYVGLCPMTEDDELDARMRELCDRDGFGGYISVNCFSFRTSGPAGLVAAAEQGIDLIGPEGDEMLQVMLRHPHVTEVVAAWGDDCDARLRSRLDAIAELITDGTLHPHPVKCLGITPAGNPRSPVAHASCEDCARAVLEEFRP